MSHQTWFKSMCATCAMLVVLAGTAGADAEMVVYDSTSQAYDAASVGIGMCGNEITLAGTERELVRADFDSISNPTAGAFDVRLRFYANDGADGKPSTLLWESDWTRVTFADRTQILSFDLPNVTVPDHLTAIIEEQWYDGLQMGNILSTGSTRGETHGLWLGNSNYADGAFSQSTGSGVLSMRLTAVPEPASLALLALGGAAILRRRRQ